MKTRWFEKSISHEFKKERGQARKGAWWMPRRPEPKKVVA